MPKSVSGQASFLSDEEKIKNEIEFAMSHSALLILSCSSSQFFFLLDWLFLLEMTHFFLLKSVDRSYILYVVMMRELHQTPV